MDKILGNVFKLIIPWSSDILVYNKHIFKHKTMVYPTSRERAPGGEQEVTTLKKYAFVPLN